jgi:uncharacterized protein (DUF2252 family)
MVKIGGEIVGRAERRERGKALRRRCPRAALGKWQAPGHERDVIAIIKRSNVDREPDLVPVRHGRMLQSPFAFYRGAAAVQAYDLARSPTSGLAVQLCGDAHLMNFGGFATPERNLVFGLNDFDETLPGPWEWDVKRLAASFVVAARYRGFRRAVARDVVLEGMRSYREHLCEYADLSALELWYASMTAADVRRETPAKLRRNVDRIEKLARSRTSEAIYPKVTTVTGGHVRIKDNPPFVFHVESRFADYTRMVQKLFETYGATLPEDRRLLLDRFKVVDSAAKVVGVGSVGTRCYIILLMADDDDPLFLQLKEARASVLEPYLGRSKHKNHGERVVFGQRVIQSASDIFLGWVRGPAGRDFYFRQLRDMKVSVDIEEMGGARLENYARVCGWALARSHAKGGDAAMLAGYLGTSRAFDEAVADYAQAYADQVERDFATFVRAVRSGKLKSDTGADQAGGL